MKSSIKNHKDDGKRAPEPQPGTIEWTASIAAQREPGDSVQQVKAELDALRKKVKRGSWRRPRPNGESELSKKSKAILEPAARKATLYLRSRRDYARVAAPLHATQKRERGRYESRPGTRRTSAPTRGSPDDDAGGEPPPAGLSGDEARQVALLVADLFPLSLTPRQFYAATEPFVFGMDRDEAGLSRCRVFCGLPATLAESFYGWIKIGHDTLAPRSAADCRRVDRQGQHVGGGVA